VARVLRIGAIKSVGSINYYVPKERPAVDGRKRRAVVVAAISKRLLGYDAGHSRQMIAGNVSSAAF
jgi:hypothetical protein